MADGDRISGAALAGHRDGDAACRQRTDVSRRNGGAPGAVREDRRRIGFAVDRYSQRGACRQAGTGARHHQMLAVFNDVNHIVARHRVHAQPRQIGVDSDIALTRTGIAVTIRDRRFYRQIAVADCAQHVCRDIHRPAEIAFNGRGVSIAADSHRNGIAVRRAADFTAESLPGRHFRGVDNIVAGDGIEGDHRQGAVDQHVVRGTAVIARAVRDAGRHGVIRFTQRADRRGRNGYRPVPAVIRDGGVMDAVKRDGDHRALRLIAGARKCQICAFFSRIDHVVIGKRVDRNHRFCGVHHHVHRVTARIPGTVSHGDVD
ncbi:hypothetical protein D3C72_950110 [compost metagenome]